MTPSLWSVLVIFVLAPLGVVLLITAVVFLLVSPSRRTTATKPIDELQDQGSERDGESDDDIDELQEEGSDLDGESDDDIAGEGGPR